MNPFNRRQFLRTSAVLGCGAFAGCGESASSGESPTSESAESEPGTQGNDTVTEPTTSESESVTFQPYKIDRHDLDVVSVIDELDRDGEDVKKYENISERVFETCIQRYIFETGRVNDDQENIWEHNLRLQVGVDPGESIQGLRAAYNQSFTPPSKPYKPALLSDYEIIQGEETDEGVRFELPTTESIRRVSSSYWQTVTDADDITVDGNVEIPYSDLKPTYLTRAIHKMQIVTTTADQYYYFVMPYPDVSFEIDQILAEETGQGLQLTEVTADVTMNSKKPEQLVNIQTDFGYPESYDYGPRIDEDDFTTVQTGGPAKVTRQFTDPSGSITDSDFRAGFPIERTNFTVLLGKVAPLATLTVPRDRFLS